MRLYFILDTLEYLYKGGRCSSLALFGANLLKIRPQILVIDGKVAFSGGINIADEYINLNSKYGHWKDNAIKVEGDAVWNYTVMFLTMWDSSLEKKSPNEKKPG